MRHTASMRYEPSEEARELLLYAENTYSIYKQLEACYTNLDSKRKSGKYDTDKAVDLFYYVADAASKAYSKEFGCSFTVTERYTVAVELKKQYEEERKGA